MATIKHARTVALQATSPRINAINLPYNVTADWATQVTGTGKPADNATVNHVQRGATFTGTPVDGDIWIDTSVTPNVIKTRVSGAWQIGANYSTNTNQLTDGAGLGTTSTWGGVSGTGKPADDATKNIVTASASAPSSPVNGDIWVDTSGTPYLLKVRVAGAWTTGARNTTDTSQLTDGAGMGTTATWGSVSGAGKPSDYADVTTTILGASGTSIVMTNANLFKSASGTAGVFIGSGGLIGKNSSGATTFSIDGSTGNATFAGSLSAATGTFAGTLSASSITSGTISSVGINITGNSGAALVAGPGLSYVYIGNIVGNGYAEISANSSSKPAVRGDTAYDNLGVHGLTSGGASQGAAHGVRGQNLYNGAAGLVGAANGYDFYADGSGTNYGPFTGSHDALVLKGAALEVGDIVVDVRVAVRKNVSNALCEVSLSTAAAQGAAVGVVAGPSRPLIDSESLPAAMRERIVTTDPTGTRVESLLLCREWFDLRHTHDTLPINALGEGQLNVCGLGGNLQPGDLITTSALPGKGQRQADDVVRASSVAKCREAVTFEYPEQVRTVACIYLCG